MVRSGKSKAWSREETTLPLWTGIWKLAAAAAPMTPDAYQHDRWLYITHVGEWRLSANQTVHFNFHLGRAILRGQRAIWLACKKYYPLSTSYHSSAGEQRPVRHPGSSYQANHWLCNDRCPGKGQGHGDTLQPQNLWTGTDWTALPMRKSMRQRKKMF